MEYYIRNGIWLDHFYGENQENKMGWRCHTNAYEADGTIKRSVGTIYSDVGRYTPEMQQEDNPDMPVLKRKKRKKLRA